MTALDPVAHKARLAFAKAVASLSLRLAEGERPDATDLAGTPFERLAERFGLTGAEMLALGLLAAAASDPAARAATSTADELARLSGMDAGRLRPTAVLSAWQLVRWGPDGPVLDPRITDWLRGLQSLDPRLLPWLSTLVPATGLLPRHAEIAQGIYRHILIHQGIVVIAGEGSRTRVKVAFEAARALDMQAVAFDPALLFEPADRRAALLRALARETVLDRVLPVFEANVLEPDLLRAAARLEVPALMLGPAVETGGPDLPYTVLLSPPGPQERRGLWRAALQLESDRMVAELAETFALGADDIARIAACLPDMPPRKRAAAAWSAARTAQAPQPDPLIFRLPARARWSDLVLPTQTLAALRAMTAQVKHRATVYRDWGMGGATDRGLGVTALFCGPSGTGKTYAAEAVAAELGLDLLRVDLAQVVDKYFGETEKHLDRVFGLAERSGAILLFDEAEALFRQRGEGEGSSRHFVSMTVAYLLQRLETTPGVCLLTTNMRSAVDDAFLRRLRFVIPFPFPGLAERRRLWAMAFPARAPASALDLERLAELPLAGGAIRTVSLNAAFLAAERGEGICMGDILAALDFENAKHNQPIDLGLLRRRMAR
ncbi:ATP-binding protein [Paracoccus sp. MBLB3053]|uniref:ATP-binding protein n=1 Tax=Paracoccus aurantius TaxID=3073814 RepID=A0ABU2HYM5_9RHOB|nr:ATP-binding protein [Paracoccus sp. MBLB3053]MDS9470136.1 ATP-binding protein [Paracoccus sp. MBLB3053]